MLLKEAVERAGAADRRKVAAVLRAIDIKDGPALLLPGRPGSNSTIRAALSMPNLVIVQWQDGVPVPVYPPHLATGTAAIWPKGGDGGGGPRPSIRGGDTPPPGPSLKGRGGVTQPFRRRVSA